MSRRRSRSGGRQDDGGQQYVETVVKINRCAAVVKGGRRFSFSALVVIGDARGKVGWGYGKANEVPDSVEKGFKDAKKNFLDVPFDGTSIPHEVTGRFQSTRVRLIPASPGTGVIAGASVRAVVEAAGIQDILTKVYGSTNPINVVKATYLGLKQLRTRQQVAALRGVEL